MENQAPHIELGRIGEDIAVKHLVKHGFRIIDKNYRKKWGEIDIIAQKERILHFIEVKTVSCETAFEDYIPEENIRIFKRQRLARTINTYLAEKEVSDETEFQVDAIAIFFDTSTKNNKIRMTENILL